jgi:hypothetical protein
MGIPQNHAPDRIIGWNLEQAISLKAWVWQFSPYLLRLAQLELEILDWVCRLGSWAMCAFCDTPSDDAPERLIDSTTERSIGDVDRGCRFPPCCSAGLNSFFAIRG